MSFIYKESLPAFNNKWTYQAFKFIVFYIDLGMINSVFLGK